MDNPQANLRVAQVAGMWLADGHITCVYRDVPRGKLKRLLPQAGYTSKDVDYLDFVRDVLSENEVGTNTFAKQRHPNRALCYTLSVHGFKRFRTWHTLLRPYLFGRKALAADILVAAYDPIRGYGPGGQKSPEQQAKEEAANTLVKRLNSTGASETIIAEARRFGLMG